MTIPFQKKLKKNFSFKKKSAIRLAKIIVWFSLGALVGFFFFVSFLYLSYRQTHDNRIYEGVTINDIDFGGKTQNEVQDYFAQKNKPISYATITLTDKNIIATISAKEIGFGYDGNLLAKQAYSIGRSGNILSDMSLMLQAYTIGIKLSPAFHYNESSLNKRISLLQKQINVAPVEALFRFENNRVQAFHPSSDGKQVDTMVLKTNIMQTFSSATPYAQTTTIAIPVNILKPKVTTENVNNMGIKELIASGTSLFQHSIENRIFNINHASSQLDGVLIAPGQVFSTATTIGDISAATGYKQAYVITNGKTVLGDGGGVCQVSTTLFRAALNAGLPIVERHPHAYRVGYYEEDSPPGIDAAIYYPTVDLKFKNDTGHYILIQRVFDPTEQRLTFNLYGTRDNRIAVVNQPVILSQSPAPETLYQDDPTLPKGEVKQIDFAAAGANVYFTRTVTKDGKVLLTDKFVSNYRPWQAIFLRGTKE